MNGHLNDIYALKLIEEKSLLLSGSGDQRIGVWSYRTGTHIQIDVITGHLESVCALKHTAAVEYLFSIDSVGVVFKWETHNFTSMGKFWEFSGTELDNCFDVSSNGRFIYAPDKDNPCWLRILNSEEYFNANPSNSGTALNAKEERLSNGDAILKKHTQEIKSIKLIEKLKLIITAGKDNMILLWHMEKHFLVRPPLYDRHSDFVSSMQIIQGTDYLLTGGNDKNLNIFDIPSNFNYFNRFKTDFRIRTVRASKDGKHIITGGHNNQTIQIIPTKLLISKLKKHEPVKKKQKKSEENLNLSQDENKCLGNVSMQMNMRNNMDHSIKNKLTKHSDRLSKTQSEADDKRNLDFLKVDDVLSFSMFRPSPTGETLINREFESLVEQIKTNPDLEEPKMIESEILNKIENIKSELFNRELKKFWKSSVQNLAEKEGNRSIFFHDYKVERKTQDLSKLKTCLEMMTKKIRVSNEHTETKLEFYSIMRIIESNQFQLYNRKQKSQANESLEILDLPSLERKVDCKAPEEQRQEMLKNCIALLQSQLES